MPDFNSLVLPIGMIWAAIAGLVTAIIVLYLMLLSVGVLGKLLFTRLTRVYHLRVIGYWLARLESEGKCCFEKASRGEPE